MNVGLYRGAVALVARQRELETVAHNLANLGTVGYKRRVTASHAFEVPRSRGTARGLATRGQTDFQQGDLTRTGRDFDLALYGQGFFAVEGPAGETYTRDGTFHLTEDGVLVTNDGHPVAWEQSKGTIDPAGLPVVIDGEGGVSQGTQEIGHLRVVGFEDQGRLQRGAGGDWIAPRGLKEAAHAAVVHQGALERSNAAGIEEMVGMITVQRSFEQVARVMSSIEESYRRLTRPF